MGAGRSGIRAFLRDHLVDEIGDAGGSEGQGTRDVRDAVAGVGLGGGGLRGGGQSRSEDWGKELGEHRGVGHPLAFHRKDSFNALVERCVGFRRCSQCDQ